MKLNNFVSNFRGSLDRTKFKIKKASPEIMLVTAIIGAGAATVLACRATLKASKKVEECKQQIEEIEASNTTLNNDDVYCEADTKREIRNIYINTGIEIAKYYAPAAIIGTLSLVSVLSSHKIMRGRNAALASAYALTSASFKEYRKRVVEKYGKDIDDALKYGTTTTQVETKIVDENGNEKTVTEEVKSINTDDDSHAYSEFAVFFDDFNQNWSPSPMYNAKFLKRVENEANKKLVERYNERTKKPGFLFLIEVLDMMGYDKENLGRDKLKAAQVVGWLYDPENPVGDNEVILKLVDSQTGKINRDFANGTEPSVLVDFNVDGTIWDMM